MNAHAASMDPTVIETEHRSMWTDVWRQFRKHKGALVGVFVFVFIIIAVSVGPLIYGVEPWAGLGPPPRH